jgi:hypothetical protein
MMLATFHITEYQIAISTYIMKEIAKHQIEEIGQKIKSHAEYEFKTD